MRARRVWGVSLTTGGRQGFGADPFLAGVGTVETIHGIQGTGVIATVKH